MNSKSFLLLAIFFSLISCSKEDYILDFREIEVYENSEDSQSNLDSAIARDNQFHNYWREDGLINQTNKENYEIGEPVYLTLKNETLDETIHIYPSKEEAGRINYFINKESIANAKLNMVSTEPVVLGYIYQRTEDYYILQINPLNNEMADNFSLSGFDKPLNPGDEIVFKLFLPPNKGTYRFVFFNFSHDNEGIGTWGLNKTWYSNAITVE